MAQKGEAQGLRGGQPAWCGGWRSIFACIIYVRSVVDEGSFQWSSRGFFRNSRESLPKLVVLGVGKELGLVFDGTQDEEIKDWKNKLWIIKQEDNFSGMIFGGSFWGLGSLLDWHLLGYKSFGGCSFKSLVECLLSTFICQFGIFFLFSLSDTLYFFGFSWVGLVVIFFMCEFC